MEAIADITLIGSGRVATHLGKRLAAKGLNISRVISRNAEHARQLGETLNVAWSDQWSDIPASTNWILLAVRDDAIGPVARAVAQYAPNALITHTSGATPGAILAPYFTRYGVFYPLQTFSADSKPAWTKIPFCVDASREADLQLLTRVARKIGKQVFQVNDAQRAYLHVAAVFANNFTNHCFAIADQMLKEHGLPFEMLHPLMEETLAKALHHPPADMQTGPAVRGDSATMQRHLELLKKHPGWRKLYEDLSESIGT
jgi:predicted short-subunit dehydrogenase-like oxidoreductase (DUF2520 family)